MYGISDILPILEEIVESKPEGYKYVRSDGSCVYRDDDGDPSCIVGHLLAKLPDPAKDEPTSLLFRIDARFNHQRFLGLCDFEISAGPRPLENIFTEDAAKFLYGLQARQDVGVPWRDALDQAKASCSAPA